ncbi:hypothetical protein CYMTET_29821 [Cymbomonas tetramitiformis]|uniref:Uncharacterized protein n=1 Tax=Cymbomonas tetramitiformis TaxID=36881 RepID=A0AAE0FKA2_9CHLO|nr:hypothetical protein CYMTET_29821 [Cymbomonas tetramitiformis]
MKSMGALKVVRDKLIASHQLRQAKPCLASPFAKFPPKSEVPRGQHNQRRRNLLILAGRPPPPKSTLSANQDASRFQKWVKKIKAKLRRKSGRAIAQRVVSTLLSMPTVPIGSYVSEPFTILHRIDPRVKQAWLIVLLLIPARSTLPVRLGVDAFLMALAVTMLPRRVWRPQLLQLGFLSLIIFVFTSLGSDSIPTVNVTRVLPPALEELPDLPGVATAYKYVLLHIGPLQVTRRGVALAANAATLSFSLLQSAHLALTTTTPEALALSLRWYLSPLRRVGVPVEELVLTTLLALRFMSLVFEE